ncbi:tRNA (cytosine(38)-C(5))-methyltransferase [Anopheles maculipalpis]|uniref:tRNA (cytosine(38)-C(5))-methyltransferase n=1 Tax=Anopheles maculipalpis TaxID=1496333 RepID=UPI00215947C0|nr:tRNA (cytosine(38)-C(5))-methyltransferase [Anopheles maculipalpis]
MESTKENTRMVLELFSGIGGMRMALEYAGKPFTIVSAIDVNPIANSIYSHNFSDKTVRNGNILSLSGEKITKLRVDTILMSPPCQPFTRNGKFNDINDRRTDPFRHICDLLDKIPLVNFILMENVKGFEKSQACELYKMRLEEGGFHWQEYILSPHQFGVPNTRHRYYCIAKRKGMDFKRKSEEIILQPKEQHTTNETNIGMIVEKNLEELEPYELKSAALLKHLPLMDVCTPESSNSMCFTKAYTHYAEGTGSVFCPLAKEAFDNIYSLAMNTTDEDLKLALLQKLGVRYFTPKEVARLMSFPEQFSFPESVTNKQRYRVLGNSINVLVVGVLLQEL